MNLEWVNKNLSIDEYNFFIEGEEVIVLNPLKLKHIGPIKNIQKKIKTMAKAAGINTENIEISC